MDTEVGHISGMLQVDKGQETPLTRQINSLTNQLLVIAGLALLASIAIGYFRYDQSFDVLFVTAIAFAVSAIPTGLPAVITTILSYGTQQRPRPAPSSSSFVPSRPSDPPRPSTPTRPAPSPSTR